MRAMLRVTALLLACLGGLAWQGSAARAEYLVEEAGLRFPDQLGAATQARGHRYPQPGLGHGIDYSGQGFGASIYVYDRGVSGIADGITSPAVRAEFARARNDIAAVQRLQNGPEPKLLGDRTMTLDGVAFLTATYRYTRNNLDTLSLVALTGLRRHFIKVRVSTRASDDGAAQARLEAFVGDVGRFLAGAGAR